MESSPAQTANPSSDQETTRARIMVVEDDVHLRDLSTKALIHEGYEVDCAENGVRAWKALHLKRYDLLITDNKMRKMTGLQLVQKLRSAGSQLPVVLASASLPAETLLEDAMLSFAAVVPKPFTLDELVGTVKRILRAATITQTIPAALGP